MSSRSFHGPTPQLILSIIARCEEHRSLKLKSLNKIQKKWCVAQFFLPTNNETEGFKSKLISKLLLLPNKRLMFQLSINIQLFRENKLDLCTSWFEFLLETAICTGRDEMRSLLPPFSEVLRITCNLEVFRKSLQNCLFIYRCCWWRIFSGTMEFFLSLSTHKFDSFIWFFLLNTKETWKVI